jgi:hypothetical protein
VTPTALQVNGVPVLSAKEFASTVSSLADHAVLVLTADRRTRQHSSVFAANTAIPGVIVMVNAEEAHLVPVIRVPQLMLVHSGEIVSRTHLTFDAESVVTALCNLRLPQAE